MSKNASLQMSISTIVTLILSMTLLGFGLMFIRSTFSQTNSQFTSVSSGVKQQLQEQLTSGTDTLVMQDVDLQVKKASSVKTAFGIRNSLGSAFLFSFQSNDGNVTDNGSWNKKGSTVQCFTDDEGDSAMNCKNAIEFDLIHKITIKQSSAHVFPLTVKPTSSAKATTYYCKMIVASPKDPSTEYAEKDFQVTVN